MALFTNLIQQDTFEFEVSGFEYIVEFDIFLVIKTCPELERLHQTNLTHADCENFFIY